MEPPQKKARLLEDDSASEQDSDSAAEEAALKINREFAKRFEHNQQRAEKQRLEEKYGSDASAGSGSEDSDSQSEDDDGELVTQELDNEISATLNAIRSKDPRVYDKQASFYRTPSDPDGQTNLAISPASKEKPVHLRDYHRKNLLEDAGELKPNADAPPTYAEEQSALKRDLLDQMHKLPVDGEDEDDDDDQDFLVRKPAKSPEPGRAKPIELHDIEMADRDPETYLSNFMAARAWVPTAGSNFQAFESEDEDEEDRADAFEAAYNLRFEDPEHANEKLISHSRDLAAKQSVRRDEPKGRKKARAEEKTRRDAEKVQREEEKARLRRLKIDEAHEKWMRLKAAAGLKQQHLSDEQLLKFLEQGFEGDDWDQEMSNLLGESYYAEEEDESLDASASEDNDASPKKSRKRPKKPKWDDDIDIGDIVPDFNEEEERQAGIFTLSDDDDDDDDDGGVEINQPIANDNTSSTDNNHPDPTNPKLDAAKARAAAKRDARLSRQKISALVDAHLSTDITASSSTANPHPTPFRYRDTSPTTHGLSARDILMASDSQLNQFAGLKKLATYRDEGKKARDRKMLGKKARLRQWRRETFGDERGGEGRSFEEFINGSRSAVGGEDGGESGRRRRKRGGEGAEEGRDDGNVLGETGEKRKKKRKRSGKKKVVAV